MQQLSGLDASFLYLETANNPMHIGSVCIYDPSTAEGGKVSFKQILANVSVRAAQVAALTNTLVEVPMSMDHPYWRADSDFDPEFHIRHIALPKPGDWRQLCIQVSRLHARQLDRAHPLWYLQNMSPEQWQKLMPAPMPGMPGMPSSTPRPKPDASGQPKRRPPKGPGGMMPW